MKSSNGGKHSFYGRCIKMRRLLILVKMMVAISVLSAGAVEPSGEGVENLVVLLRDYGTTDFYVGGS